MKRILIYSILTVVIGSCGNNQNTTLSCTAVTETNSASDTTGSGATVTIYGGGSNYTITAPGQTPVSVASTGSATLYTFPTTLVFSVGGQVGIKDNQNGSTTCTLEASTGTTSSTFNFTFSPSQSVSLSTPSVTVTVVDPSGSSTSFSAAILTSAATATVSGSGSTFVVTNTSGVQNSVAVKFTGASSGQTGTATVYFGGGSNTGNLVVSASPSTTVAAGASVDLSVSNGAGPYTFTASSSVTMYAINPTTVRAISNTAQTVVFNITDTAGNTGSITITWGSGSGSFNCYLDLTSTFINGNYLEADFYAYSSTGVSLQTTAIYVNGYLVNTNYPLGYYWGLLFSNYGYYTVTANLRSVINGSVCTASWFGYLN